MSISCSIPRRNRRQRRHACARRRVDADAIAKSSREHSGGDRRRRHDLRGDRPDLGSVVKPTPIARGAVASVGAVENVEPRGCVLATKDVLMSGQVRLRLVPVEFTDFECGYCIRHARDTLPQLRRDFNDIAEI
jgi:hypothetical protein